ncbi:MAG TPA: LytR family transcriptional regulator, partial [Pseudonocardiaceae bacterium]
MADQRGYPPADYRPGGRPPGGGLPPAPPRRRRRWRIRRILAVVLVLLLVGAVVTWFSMDSALHRVNALSDYTGRPAPGSGTNWLIVGSDSRQGLTNAQAAQLHTGDASAVSGGRTDTIMV